MNGSSNKRRKYTCRAVSLQWERFRLRIENIMKITCTQIHAQTTTQTIPTPQAHTYTDKPHTSHHKHIPTTHIYHKRTHHTHIPQTHHKHTLHTTNTPQTHHKHTLHTTNTPHIHHRHTTNTHYTHSHHTYTTNTQNTPHTHYTHRHKNILHTNNKIDLSSFCDRAGLIKYSIPVVC